LEEITTIYASLTLSISTIILRTTSTYLQNGLTMTTDYRLTLRTESITHPSIHA